MKEHGVIMGQTIVLNGPADLFDGQWVEVAVRPLDDVPERARKIRNKLEALRGGKFN